MIAKRTTWCGLRFCAAARPVSTRPRSRGSLPHSHGSMHRSGTRRPRSAPLAAASDRGPDPGSMAQHVAPGVHDLFTTVESVVRKQRQRIGYRTRRSAQAASAAVEPGTSWQSARFRALPVEAPTASQDITIVATRDRPDSERRTASAAADYRRSGQAAATASACAYLRPSLMRRCRPRIASCARGEPSWKLPNHLSSGTCVVP